MLDIQGYPAVNGETLPMDIWSLYMAQATSGDPVLGVPRSDRREVVPLRRGYALNPAWQQHHRRE
jgi:hypothetical protein